MNREQENAKHTAAAHNATPLTDAEYRSVTDGECTARLVKELADEYDKGVAEYEAFLDSVRPFSQVKCKTKMEAVNVFIAALDQTPNDGRTIEVTMVSKPAADPDAPPLRGGQGRPDPVIGEPLTASGKIDCMIFVALTAAVISAGWVAIALYKGWI